MKSKRNTKNILKTRNSQNRLFIGNLDYSSTVSDVRDVFTELGYKTVDVFFPKKKDTAEPIIDRTRKVGEPINYGCAFVELESPEFVESVLSKDMKVKDKNGRTIYFSKAK